MEENLNGPKFIKKIVRPPRIAFIVSNLNDVKKFISISSLSWGGRYFLAIPCSDKGEIREEWFDVIKRYNPDSIKTFHQLPQEIEERLWRSRFSIIKKTKYTKSEIDHLYSEKHIPEFFGQPIINFFLLDDLYESKDDKAKITYISTESNFDLFYKAKFGVIDSNEWHRWQYVYINPSHRKFRADEVLENTLENQEQDLLPFLHQNRRETQNNRKFSILDYTMNRLGQVYIDRFPTSERPKTDVASIVIISKEENTDDFCWFWNLRAQRYNPFDYYVKSPIWIKQESFLQNIDHVRELFAGEENIYIISTSVSGKDLPQLPQGYIFQDKSLQEFYNDHYYIGDTADFPVNFVNNKTEYKFESPDSLKYLNFSQHQFALYDLQIPGLTLPKVNDFSFDNFYIPNYRMTKSGFTHRIISNENKVVDFLIPTPREIISTFASSADFSVEISDKGRIGEELVQLINGQYNNWVFSHPAVLDLLLEMSNVNKVNKLRKLIRENINDENAQTQLFKLLPRKSLKRNNMSFSAIKGKLKLEHNGNKLDEKSSITIINWLLEKNILQQGKIIKCSFCSTENWVPVGEFSTKITCQGCIKEIANPFGIDKIDWDYELNTLVSSEIDQGLLIHLLTGFYVIDKANSSFTGNKSNIYGTYYGINFQKGSQRNEVDVAFLIDGKLILGECKISGKEFSGELIQESIEFARKIGAQSLIFSCLEHVEEIIQKIEVFDTKGLEITILGKDDLLYQFPGLASLAQIDTKKKVSPTTLDKTEYFKRSLELLKENNAYKIDR